MEGTGSIIQALADEEMAFVGAPAPVKFPESPVEPASRIRHLPALAAHLIMASSVDQHPPHQEPVDPRHLLRSSAKSFASQIRHSLPKPGLKRTKMAAIARNHLIFMQNSGGL